MRKLWLLVFLLCIVIVGKPSFAATKADIKELFQQSCLWAVGDTAKVVQKATAELIALGDPAYKYIIANEMDTADTLRTRAIFEILGKKPTETLPLLLEGFAKETKLNAKANYIAMFGQIKAKESIPLLVQIMKNGINGSVDDKKLIRSIVYALIDLDAKEAAPDIVPLLKDDKYFTIIAAASALGAFHSGDTWQALVLLLGNDRFEQWLPAQDNLVRWLNTKDIDKSQLINYLSDIVRGKIELSDVSMNKLQIRRRALITLARATANDSSNEIKKVVDQLLKELKEIKIPELQSGVKEAKWLFRRITH